VAFDGPASWTLPKLSAAARDAQDRIAGLLGSPQALKLRTERRAALRSGRPVSAASALLEGLETLGARVEELIEESLDRSNYDEKEQPIPKEVTRNYDRKTTRVRTGFEGVVYASNPEALINTCAPVLDAARVELELLADQLHASEAPDETATVLFEPVGPPSSAAVGVFAQSLPQLGALDVLPDAPNRRAYVFHGPGVKAQLEPWLGYARIEVEGKDGSPRRALVRAVLLEGGDGTLDGARAVLAAWDEKAKTEREARRQGAAIAEERWPRVVLERLTVSGPCRFVATGLESTQAMAHLAACLRENR